MYKEILINIEPQEKRIAILEERNLEEFYVERKTSSALFGNIYKGKVDQIAPGIGAAFIDLGLKKDGFLYVSDIVHPLTDYEEVIEESLPYEEEKTPRRISEVAHGIKTTLKKGQEILVQVVKEPIGTKGVRLTTHITLPGRYLVLMPHDPHIGISKRIEDEKERERIKAILNKLNLPKDMGFIVRTAGAGRGNREFARDVKYLRNLWHKIKSRAEGLKAPSLIHQEYDLVLRVIRDSFTEDISRLIVDSRDEHRKISHFLNSIQPSLKSRLEFYRYDEPLFEKKKIETAIEKIYERKITLKSGGHIIIEPTEGLIAIDVNTGKFTGRRRLEETAFLVNQEAAQEIARQIRLRDIGGIIVIDFIDMESELHRKKVFTALEEALRRDKAKTDILPLSGIGLIEMTRQRRRLSLESVSYEICPYCKGRGSVKSPVTTSISVIRKMKRYFKQTSRREAFVLVHPEVASRLLKEDRSSISEVEDKFKGKIIVMADPNLHIEEIRIKAA